MLESDHWTWEIILPVDAAFNSPGHFFKGNIHTHSSDPMVRWNLRRFAQPTVTPAMTS
jgi:hypothetical protein